MVLVEFVDRSADGLAFGVLVFRHCPLTRPWLPYHVQFSWQPGPGSQKKTRQSRLWSRLPFRTVALRATSWDRCGCQLIVYLRQKKTSLRLHSTSREPSPSSKCSHSLLRECLLSVVLLCFPSFTNRLVIAVDLSARLYQTLGSTSIVI